ncbi:MAG TPA: hypothetical protein VHL11_23190, partial [Phototrophicaceae bacterium]|nr:hypothetical protein [Phototrophicaceae bacterium]
MYQSPFPTPMLFVLRPAPIASNTYRLIEERRSFNPVVPIHEYIDGFGNQIWRLVAPVGTLQIDYNAIAEVSPLPDPILDNLPKTMVE